MCPDIATTSACSTHSAIADFGSYGSGHPVAALTNAATEISYPKLLLSAADECMKHADLVAVSVGNSKGKRSALSGQLLTDIACLIYVKM